MPGSVGRVHSEDEIRRQCRGQPVGRNGDGARHLVGGVVEQRKLLDVTVIGLMGSLNVRTMSAVMGTFVAPAAGCTCVIAGRSRSTPALVVKVAACIGCIALPATSVTAPTLTVYVAWPSSDWRRQRHRAVAVDRVRSTSRRQTHGQRDQVRRGHVDGLIEPPVTFTSEARWLHHCRACGRTEGGVVSWVERW